MMNSGITVNVPIEVFGKAKNLSPQELIDALGNSLTMQSAEDKIEALITVINNIGRNLEKIMNESPDEFQKAHSIRNIIQVMKTYGK